MRKLIAAIAISVSALLSADVTLAKDGLHHQSAPKQSQPAFIASDITADDELPDSIPAVPAGGGLYKASSLPDGCVAVPEATICGGGITVTCKNPPSQKSYRLRCGEVSAM